MRLAANPMVENPTHLPLPVLLLLNDVCKLWVHFRERRVKQLWPLQYKANLRGAKQSKVK